MNYFRFLNFAQWANMRVLEMLRNCPRVEPQAHALFSHMLAAEHVWLCRLQGNTPDIAIWPELGLDECERLIEMNVAGYKEYLKGCTPETWDSIIAYRTTKGQDFKTPVSDILMHVLNHGTYHRGQVTAAVKRSGGEVLDTDYIIFVRESH